MIAKNTFRRIASGILAVTFFCLFAGSAHAAGMTEGWTRVASRGFNDPNNTYGPGVTEFKGYLYISTVASASTAIFSKSSKQGGDIWRSQDGIKWEQVGKPGLGNTHNQTFSFAIFRNKLYAISNNLDEHGIEIWATEDGRSFNQIEKGGFGDKDNNFAYALVFHDRLIVGVSGAKSGPQIWVSDDGLTFRQVVSGGLGDKENTGIIVMIGEREGMPVLDGKLYVGTSNPQSGGEIWRTADGLQWERVADRGIERSLNTSLTPFLVFKGQLYVVGVSGGGLDKLKGLEVYRTMDGNKWQRVVTDGFSQGKERNVAATPTEFQNKLYLTADTMDPRVLVPGRPTERLAPRGFQLWVSDDGEKWAQVGKDGFGASTNLCAEMTVIGGTAYLAAFDYHQGSQLWSSSDGQTWKMIFREPDPNFFNQGGGVVDFKGHLLWIGNNLARGLDIWRADAPWSRNSWSAPRK
jgi:hypothetical protein